MYKISNFSPFGDRQFQISPHSGTGNYEGFTLIEILVVIALIGVLTSTVVTIVNPIAQIQKAKDVHRKSDLSQIQKALELYYHDNGRYPPVTSGYRIDNVSWGASWQPYMQPLPKDPDIGRTYVYNTSADGQSYWLYAHIDRGSNDPQACNAGNDCSNVPGGNLCGGVSCNYGVSSPNVSP